MNQLRNLDVRFVSLVNRAAVRQAEDPSQPQRFLIWKSDSSTQGDDMPATVEKTAEEIKADLEKAEQERDAALEAVTKAEGERDTLNTRVGELEKAAADAKAEGDGKPEPDEDDLSKADLSPAVRARLEKAAKDGEEMRARMEKAEELAKSERDERLTAVYVTKAEGYKSLVQKAEEFGPLLKRAADALSKEDFEALQTVLKAADEQIAKGELFKEQGAGGEAQRSGAYEEAMRKVDELRKSDSKISHAKALDKVFKEDKALEERYLAENR
jgi:hypothetical protein